MDARRTTHWIGDYRLRLRDVHFAAQHFGAFHSTVRERIAARAFKQGAAIAFPLTAGACWCSSRTFSPEQSRTKTVGAIAGFRRGSYQLRMESAAARWGCLPSRQSALVVELRTPQWSLPRVLYIIGLAVDGRVGLRPRSLSSVLVIWTSQTLDTRYGAGVTKAVAEVSSDNRLTAPGIYTD